MHPLRRRLEHSTLLARILAWIAGRYLLLCQYTTRWTVEGLEDLSADLAEGPVLLVLWHERSVIGALHWPVAAGQLSSLYASSPIGRVSGALQRQFGLRPMEMAEGQSNLAASRVILRRVREGVSIGLTGDGPLGPALQVKDAPLDWARAMDCPVWGYAFATARHRRLKAWDRMILPLPFTRGAVVFRKWEQVAPRKATADQIEELRIDMAALLNAVAQRADDLIEPGA